MRVNDMIENVKLSIVLRRKTRLQASFRETVYGNMYMCMRVGGFEEKIQTIITGYHLNPNQKQYFCP